VLRIAHNLAGLSLADADLLRRAMSHFDPGKEMQTLKEKFIQGASFHSGVPDTVAEQVWELMAAFAGYGFPKAHAASYAQVAWRSAWCKAHHPAIFIAAVLANWGGYYGQGVYLTEARRLGLTLRPPNINHAQPEFSVSYPLDQPVLYMGLNQVRELTRRTQYAILRQRPFGSLVDFLVRVDPRPVEAQNLIRCGALGGLGTIPELIQQMEQGTGRRGQMPLFSITSKIDEWSLAERAAAQQAILGASLDAHPLELYAAEIASAQAETTLYVAGQLGKRVRVAGMRQSWRRSSTRRGEYIYFMALEDLEGQLDVIITADVYRRNRNEIKGEGPFIIEGTADIDQNTAEPTIRADRIWRLEHNQ
jgi:DNA polymerase III alpha subunit